MNPEIFETPVPLSDYGRTHLIGIGGAGVSVIARLLVAEGVPVQGSDAVESAVLDGLRESGINAWGSHDAAHVVGPNGPLVDTVVISSAVRETNPELKAARDHGLRVLHRSHALASLMAGQQAVAVAGAHGKTTTSAMIATVLKELGLDPSFAIGGSVVVKEPDGTIGHIPGGYHGTGTVLVAEADESDGSFLNYQPLIAVVTNVEPDHLDHYGDVEAFEAAFDQFAKRIRPEGFLIACSDDAGSAALAQRHRDAGGKVITYGTTPGSDVLISNPEILADGAKAKLTGRPVWSGVDWVVAPEPIDLDLQVPGIHNLRNAAAAVITANLLSPGSATQAAKAAGNFLGTGRRFEYRGEANGVRVYDDYAHHPTEIEALLAGARPFAGNGRLIVLFQPHLYSRTKNFADRFAAALEYADAAVITGVYKAREDVDPTVGAHTIIEAAAPGTKHLQAVEDKLEAAHRVAAEAQPGDLVITVGAGDVTELADVILADLTHAATNSTEG